MLIFASVMQKYFELSLTWLFLCAPLSVSLRLRGISWCCGSLFQQLMGTLQQGFSKWRWMRTPPTPPQPIWITYSYECHLIRYQRCAIVTQLSWAVNPLWDSPSTLWKPLPYMVVRHILFCFWSVSLDSVEVCVSCCVRHLREKASVQAPPPTPCFQPTPALISDPDAFLSTRTGP